MLYCHWQHGITKLHVLPFLSLAENKCQSLISIPIGYFTNVGWDNNETLNSYGLCCTPKLISRPSVTFPCWVWINRIGWLCKSQWTTGSLLVPDLPRFWLVLVYHTEHPFCIAVGLIVKTSFATFKISKIFEFWQVVPNNIHS